MLAARCRVKALRALLGDFMDWKQQAVAQVQEIYDAWEQDDEGIDEQYGGGGICDDVADAVATAMMDAGFEAFTHHYEQDNHTVTIARMGGQTFEIDIPLHIYEKGSFYNYTKIPGVTFTTKMITVVPLGDEALFDEMSEEY